MILNGTKYDWQLAPVEPGVAAEIASGAGVSGTFARVLAARGVDSAESAARFLSASEDSLSDARLLPDAEVVVERVRRALVAGELIAIHGHDDADGVTASTVMVEALDQLSARLTSYIPDRKTEGHGLSRGELDRLSAAGVGLVITVDSCVSDREHIAYAAGLGTDVIVTDHHEIPPVLPPAVAIVNPKLPTSGFPYRYMAGVGVSLRVADLLLDELSGEFGPTRDSAPWYGPRWRGEALALAAIGSVADRVPLTGENRAIVTQGLALIPATERIGLRVALEQGRLWGREPAPDEVRESLGPLLGRAPGSTPGSQRAYDLLTARDAETAREIASALYERQASWRESATGAWRRVRAQFERAGGDSNTPMIILEVDVPIGVVGYVTSRLAEESGRPTIVIAPRGAEAMAEARGPVGFNFVDAFSAMRDLFIGYGGHPRAAGFSIEHENVPVFRERMEAHVRENPPAPVPRRVDAELDLEDATPELGDELEAMAPFGQSNGRALFLACRVTSESVADAESRGVRFGTPVRIGGRPMNVVFRLRNAAGVPMVSIIDSFPSE